MAFKRYVLVCGATACENATSDAVYRGLLLECEEKGIKADVEIVKTGCFGFCEKGPVVKVLPDEALYIGVKEQDVKEIVAEHLVGGRPVQRLLYNWADSKRHARVDEVDFYQKQFRIVLRNCGVIDPDRIEEYIARDGYVGLERALFELTPDQVLDELKKSGLRGRGGAGFPTWLKWKLTKDASSDVRYVVCNADEGDPGAYMNRSTLEGDPHSILEAMTICGRAVGASRGYIYIRAEYPLAIQRLENAISQARAMALLGPNILGSGFDFDIELRLGAGAFVCGEETALLASIEGNRGMPVPRPPFPSVRGLWGKPTVINNVETWANVPVIIARGGDWFARVGSGKSSGTKVFALTGKIMNSGLVEVPMGTTLREIIFDVGGGIRDGRQFKAVQTGGPSGGVITKEHLDTPIDYEHLQQLGSIMGSGGMIVMDDQDCMVDIAKFYLGFTVDESCGKCAPCRIGGPALRGILEKIAEGKGTLEDVEKMRAIGHAMQRASLCGLGQTSPNPILSTLRYFEDEYLAHINDRRCPARKCKSLVQYTIKTDKCIGCTLCARRCPVTAIKGERRQPHVIDNAICIKCGECYSVCKFDAVEVR